MLENQTQLITKKDPLLASLDVRNVGIREFRVIKDILYPNVQKDETLLMAIDYCKSRKLDIMKRPIQIVPIWDSKTKTMKDTIWTSIAEIRTTATRTGKYAGRTEAEFGEEVTENLGGTEVTYPRWCKITVFRLVENQKCSFSAKIFWKEAYKTIKNDSLAPNSMWAKRAYGQLEKCCEAAALRSAFPEEFGNDYIAEEAFDQNEAIVTAKSKTEAAHLPLKDIIEASFEPLNKEEVIDEAGDLLPQVDEKSEEIYNRVTKNLDSLMNKKAVEAYTSGMAEELKYLAQTRADYHAHVISLIKDKLARY
jgi:phage recombination protein Bet